MDRKQIKTMHNAAWAVTSMGTQHRKYTTRAKQADTRHPHDVESREQQRLIIIAPYIYFCMLTAHPITPSCSRWRCECSHGAGLRQNGRCTPRGERKDKARNEWSVVVCFFAFAMGVGGWMMNPVSESWFLWRMGSRWHVTVIRHGSWLATLATWCCCCPAPLTVPYWPFRPSLFRTRGASRLCSPVYPHTRQPNAQNHGEYSTFPIYITYMPERHFFSSSPNRVNKREPSLLPLLGSVLLRPSPSSNLKRDVCKTAAQRAIAPPKPAIYIYVITARAFGRRQ